MTEITVIIPSADSTTSLATLNNNAPGNDAAITKSLISTLYTLLAGEDKKLAAKKNAFFDKTSKSSDNLFVRCYLSFTHIYFGGVFCVGSGMLRLP